MILFNFRSGRNNFIRNDIESFEDMDQQTIGKAVVIGSVVGLIIVISIISIFSFSDEGSGGRAEVYGHYTDRAMCWKGAFHNGDSIISISGCGPEIFYCSDKSSCSINAQKDEDNSHELCVIIGDKSACTTAGYGVAQV